MTDEEYKELFKKLDGKIESLEKSIKRKFRPWVATVLSSALFSTALLFGILWLTGKFQEPQNWQTVVLAIGIMGILAWVIASVIRAFSDQNRY